MLTSTGQRSHHGCTRCKRRRQKCDELKPSCSRCAQTGSSICSYSKELKWEVAPRGGGRKKASSMRQQSIEEQSIESIISNEPVVNSTTNVARSPNPSIFSQLGHGSATVELVFNRDIDTLSWLPSSSRSLLYHFMTKASHITSCHQQIQIRVCRLIIPMALQTPCLLFATMALSALHHSTLIDSTPKDFALDGLVSSLMASSLESLRNELQAENGASKYALLLTIRTLAVCEIHSGKADAGSWRAHVDGAKALLEKSRAIQTTVSTDEHEPQWLVNNWYESIESLTALTTRRGLLRGQLEQFGPRALIREANPENRYLDTYTAYSTDLNEVFKEIGAAAWERRRINEQGDTATILSDIDLDEEAKWLEFSVRAMIGKSSFRPRELQFLSQNEVQEFEACNEAYQLTALIHILRRVQQLPTSDPRVQEHVKNILSCASKIKPTDGLSPWVMLSTPLFTAGCEALGKHRDTVRGLLNDMYKLLRIRNIKRCLEILEISWARDKAKNDDDWESPLGQNDWDFIPY